MAFLDHFLFPALGAMVDVVIYSRGAYGKGETAIRDDLLLPAGLEYGSCACGTCMRQSKM